MKKILLAHVKESLSLKQRFFDQELDHILVQADDMAERLRRGCRVLVCGNGGSAADAQHFAAELSGRFVKERRALAGIALTTDTSALTSIGNDYGFDRIFSRQVEALRTRLAGRTALLDSLSPLGVLARGYAIARTMPEGRVIRDAKDLSTGDPVGINVAKGRFDAVVTKIEEA